MSYYRHGERVYLRGVALITTDPADAAIFTLDAGYRPEYLELFFGVGQTSSSDIEGLIIYPDGRVTTFSNPGTTGEFILLAGISFVASE